MLGTPPSSESNKHQLKWICDKNALQKLPPKWICDENASKLHEWLLSFCKPPNNASYSMFFEV